MKNARNPPKARKLQHPVHILVTGRVRSTSWGSVVRFVTPLNSPHNTILTASITGYCMGCWLNAGPAIRIIDRHKGAFLMPWPIPPVYESSCAIWEIITHAGVALLNAEFFFVRRDRVIVPSHRFVGGSYRNWH